MLKLAGEEGGGSRGAASVAQEGEGGGVRGEPGCVPSLGCHEEEEEGRLLWP